MPYAAIDAMLIRLIYADAFRLPPSLIFDFLSPDSFLFIFRYFAFFFSDIDALF